MNLLWKLLLMFIVLVSFNISAHASWAWYDYLGTECREYYDFENRFDEVDKKIIDKLDSKFDPTQLNDFKKLRAIQDLIKDIRTQDTYDDSLLCKLYLRIDYVIVRDTHTLEKDGSIVLEKFNFNTGEIELYAEETWTNNILNIDHEVNTLTCIDVSSWYECKHENKKILVDHEYGGWGVSIQLFQDDVLLYQSNQEQSIAILKYKPLYINDENDIYLETIYARIRILKSLRK